VYAGPGNSSAISAVDTLVGHVHYAMDFTQGTSWATISNPGWLLSRWDGTGYQMIWGVDMLPNSGASLAAGATGLYNQYYVSLADALVAGGQGNSIIRLGWEFNGGWFPWAAKGQAQDFVTYWQQIVDSMRSVPGESFQFEWNPTRGDLGVGNLANFYPGDAYVDIIGLDVYDIEWATYPGAQAEWQHMLTQTYGLDWLASFASEHNKPVAFPEWGLGWGKGDNGAPVSNPGGEASGGDNAYFVQQMAQWILNHDVSNAVAWDYGSNPLPSTTNPLSQATFAQSFGLSSAETTTTTSSTTTSEPATSTTTSEPATSTTTTQPATSTTTTTQPATSTTPTTQPATSTTTTLPTTDPRPRHHHYWWW